MSLVSSFEVQLQAFSAALSRRSFGHFVTILTGWVLCGRRTITRMLIAAGVVGQKHHSIFHRFFAKANWSLDLMGLLLFRMLEPFLSDPCLLSLDDTLAHKRGRKMYGVGMHHDPLLSGQGKIVTAWGHNWIVLAVIVRFPIWPERVFSLPVLARLYVNKKSSAKWNRPYRTHGEIALQMIHLLCNSCKNRHFHVVADSAYGGRNVLAQLPANCDLTTGLTLDARLYTAAPPPTGRRGRPRVRGDRLPSPQQMLHGTRQHMKMRLYGRKQDLEFAETTAYLHYAPQRPVKIVAVEPLQVGCKRRAYYSTCHSATAQQVLGWYAQRWSVEVTFHDAKQHLGFEDPPGWTRRAVERTAPMAMFLYSLIVIWFVQHAAHHAPVTTYPWYRSKQLPSFRDMLLALRRESLEEAFLALGPDPIPLSKIQKTLQYVLEIAV